MHVARSATKDKSAGTGADSLPSNSIHLQLILLLFNCATAAVEQHDPQGDLQIAIFPFYTNEGCQ
jgi:hypothetical protein